MNTFLKNSCTVFVLLILISNCTNRKSETKEKEKQWEFDAPLKVIESHFDSLNAIYQNAIDSLKNNPRDSVLVKHQFQSKASHHFNLISETMENVNKQYENKEIAVDQYDNYVLNLQRLSAGFMEKKAELAKYGVSFKLR
jgi:hypothetical protein